MIGARPPAQGITYPVSELARRYGASVGVETDDPQTAYGSVPGLVRPQPGPYSWPLS